MHLDPSVEAVRGRTGNAGNVAHLIVDPDGPPCPCGLRGCLGPSVEPRRLLEDAGLRPAVRDAAVAWARLSRALAPLLFDRLGVHAALTTTRPIEFRESRLGTDAAAVGAACLMLDRSFTARPADLLITP